MGLEKRITVEMMQSWKEKYPVYNFELFKIKFRYRKNDKGYFSEMLHKGFFSNKWIPVVTYRGTEKPYYFKTLQACNEGFINHIKEEIRFYNKII